jgi:thiamine kinase-like enzyme
MRPPDVPEELIDAAELGADAHWTWLAGLGDGAWRVHSGRSSDVVVRPASEFEQRAARAAAEADVGPTVVATTGRWLVVEYLSGSHLTALELSRPYLLRELGQLLRRWHDCDVHLPPVDLAEARHGYEERLASADLSSTLMTFAEQADDVEERLVSAHVTRVPAHLDVVANLMSTPSGLRLIDFEYAGTAEPARELGQVIWEAQLDARGARRLLEGYGPRDGVTEESTREWAWVTGVTWTLWALSRAADASTRCYARRSVEQMNTFWGQPTP